MLVACLHHIRCVFMSGQSEEVQLKGLKNNVFSSLRPILKNRLYDIIAIGIKSELMNYGKYLL